MNPRHPGHEHDTKPPGEVITPPPATTEDVNLGVIVRFAVGLLVVVGLVSAFLIFFMKELDRRARAGDPPPSKVAGETRTRVSEYGVDLPRPDGVRLQRQPFDDAETLRKDEKALLDAAGWVDEGTGIARIPIDDAMRLVVQRGLPTRPILADGASASGPSFAAAVPTPSPAPTARPRPRPVSPSTPKPETPPPAPSPSEEAVQ